MLHEYLSSSPLTALLNAHDTPLQATLQKKLSALDIQITELFQNQPAFHVFIQYSFDQAFPDVAPRLDLPRSFIRCNEKDSASYPGTGTEQDVTLDTLPLLPSLMDAVVQRIVSDEASNYADRQTRFYRSPEAGGEPELFTGITAEAFDRYLDRLAGGLLSHYTQYVDAYWTGPYGLTDSRTRKQWLIDMRTEQLKTEVALLESDGLLNATDEALFAKVLRYPDVQARGLLRGYRPCVFGVALKGGEAVQLLLHGAFILTSRDPQDAEVTWDIGDAPRVARTVDPITNVGQVLLYTPSVGLEAFESLASLDRELHRRLSHAVEFTTLLSLMADKDQPRGLALHRTAPARGQLQYLERLDSPFSYGIESQCQLIRQNLASTIVRYQAQGVQADMASLPRGLDRVTDLRRIFSIDTILWARVRKRCQARLMTFLQWATPADKNAWSAAMANHGEELANLPESEGLPSLAQFSDRRELLAYSNRQLRAALEAEYGLTVNPDDIMVHTREPSTPPIVIAPGASGSGIQEPGNPLYKHRQRTLTELALENVGGLDANFSKFSRLTLKPEGHVKPDEALLPEDMLAAATFKPYEGLTLEQVKDLVRTVNVGRSYVAFLRETLVTSPGAAVRKQTFARIMERQLRLDAIEAKINGDFLPDRLERGFNWVQTVLDAPVDSDQRREVEGHRILVQHLKLRGQRVRGVLIFRTASAAGGSVVVYTPQAPGGRVFHEYANEHLMIDFIHNSTWREYLIGRVERAFQPQVQAVLRGRGDASMVQMTRIADNFFEEAYEVAVNFAINDAAAQATTTEQTNVETGLTIATTAFDILTMILPVHVTLPIGLARSLFSIFNALDAANLGDRAGAAHHIVRAMGEFVGALVDGVVGAGFARGTLGGAPRLAGARGLNPELALRKTPQGLLPLPGWEGKGIYYKISGIDGTKQYFLNARNHWYSILDEGFEEAWRVRDARKPLQMHYSPIRQDSAGQWEIGTHHDAPALGGFSPDTMLRDLYPFLDEVQVRRVFDSFVFPRGREMEYELSLVHYLRSGAGLGVFEQFQRVTTERLQLRLRGLDAPHALVAGTRSAGSRQAGPVDPVPGPSRPRPVEPAPGPRQPNPVPPRRVRPPNEQFVDWGQVIDPAELRVQSVELGIYRRTGGDPGLPGRDYVKINERFFPILPAGAPMRRGLVFMYDPDVPISTFIQFEQLLRTNRFNQPRLAEFNNALWLFPIELPFEKSLAEYVADAFTTFTVATQLQVANTLFNRANPTGLTGWGLAALQRTLQNWRSWPSATRASLGEPLTMLPRMPRSHDGTWQLNSLPGYYNRLQFSTDGVPLLLHNALTSRTEGTLRALMIERLTGSRYEMVAGYSPVSELIFRRPGSEQVYWLSLRRVVGNVVEGGQYVSPSFALMERATRELVTQAQANSNLVVLIGGIHLPAEGSAVNIFIFRT